MHQQKQARFIQLHQMMLAVRRDRQSLKSLATVGIRHFLDVVLHASNKKNVDKWHIALRRHLNKNVAASIWFLSCLSQGEWLSEILLECDSRNSREMLVSLAGASISAVSPFENGNQCLVVRVVAGLANWPKNDGNVKSGCEKL